MLKLGRDIKKGDVLVLERGRRYFRVETVEPFPLDSPPYQGWRVIKGIPDHRKYPKGITIVPDMEYEVLDNPMEEI